MFPHLKTCIQVIIVFLVLLLPGCGKKDEQIVLKLAHGLDTSHPVHKAMVYMSQRVSSLSDGRVKIDVYPSEQLGSERECLELLQIGSLAMTKVSASVLENFVPGFKVFSLPYLFRDKEHLLKILRGEIGKKLLLSSQEYLLRGLTYYDAGSRSFYMTDAPVKTPSDLSGKKIRTQESATAMQMVNIMGGSATPIAWGELYTALQQGVVDGAENNPPSFYFSHHFEVCKYYSLDEHTSVPDVLLISTIIWKDLPDEVRQLLQKAADESFEYQVKLWEKTTQFCLNEVQKAGVKVYYPDKKPFMEKVQPMIEGYRDQPEIYKLITEIKAVD